MRRLKEFASAAISLYEIHIPQVQAGCRFITVDTLQSAERFYNCCDFKRLVNPELEDETVLMYFDLKGLM